MVDSEEVGGQNMGRLHFCLICPDPLCWTVVGIGAPDISVTHRELAN